MRQKSLPEKESATQVVKNMRRATRRHSSAEDKIRVGLVGLRGEDSRRAKSDGIKLSHLEQVGIDRHQNRRPPVAETRRDTRAPNARPAGLCRTKPSASGDRLRSPAHLSTFPQPVMFL